MGFLHLRSMHKMECVKFTVLLLCSLTGLPARQEVVRDPTLSAIMTHHER